MADSLSVRCAVCSSPFARSGPRLPRWLPCNHTLCHTCVGNLVQDHTIVCPLDRQGHWAGANFSKTFPPNEAVLEKLRSTQTVEETNHRVHETVADREVLKALTAAKNQLETQTTKIEARKEEIRSRYQASLKGVKEWKQQVTEALNVLSEKLSAEQQEALKPIETSERALQEAGTRLRTIAHRAERDGVAEACHDMREVQAKTTQTVQQSLSSVVCETHLIPFNRERFLLSCVKQSSPQSTPEGTQGLCFCSFAKDQIFFQFAESH